MFKDACCLWNNRTSKLLVSNQPQTKLNFEPLFSNTLAIQTNRRNWNCCLNWGWDLQTSLLSDCVWTGLCVDQDWEWVGPRCQGCWLVSGCLLTLSFDVCVPLSKQEQPPGHRYWTVSQSLLCFSSVSARGMYESLASYISGPIHFPDHLSALINPVIMP